MNTSFHWKVRTPKTNITNSSHNNKNVSYKKVRLFAQSKWQIACFKYGIKHKHYCKKSKYSICKLGISGVNYQYQNEIYSNYSFFILQLRKYVVVCRLSGIQLCFLKMWSIPVYLRCNTFWKKTSRLLTFYMRLNFILSRNVEGELEYGYKVIKSSSYISDTMIAFFLMKS